ncbi:hypothetical protein DOTSEDRAFT_73856 [Dothistroma septosporum NZE10]|uniref:Uncharacterized protein n=1 Tax=Dothistroma septosporum (strain NZE10 / CBS 128990) TaxID=675120 RepID=N1PG18_DOTSN|nr:hypothetical protein DOTSEDRAFT_73856 [Dothistroma septosporum NZE10]
MEEDDKYKQYAHIAIPTYDEATSSRPSSSQTFRGPGEVSDDAERQGLLPQESTYRPPTVESPRSSMDSDLRLPEVTGDGDQERRRVEELDYLDPSAPDPSQRQSLYHRARLRSKWTQHIANIGATLSAIRLPSFRSLYTPVSAGETTSTDPPPSRFSQFSTIPDRYRMSPGTIARLCGLLFIAMIIYGLFLLDVFPGNGRGFMGTRFDPESVRRYVQDNVDAGRIEEYLTHITGYDHVAGTAGDLYMAEWIRERWIKEGNLDDVAVMSYYAYLNYPTQDGREVSITAPKEQEWTARLEEDILNMNKVQTLAWHGLSKSGEIEGHLIYANGGSKEDFGWLLGNGVKLNGSIALMRYYSTQNDLSQKVRAAQDAGCVGALVYSDPKDDGSVLGAIWPDGPWRPESSLQRGSVAMSDRVLGDPLTPGFASTQDAKREPIGGSPALTRIPSLPLAWRDAKVLLELLEGKGKQVPETWVGGDGGFLKDWSAGGPDGVRVHLKNINDESEKQQIWNVHGLVEGLEQAEKKILVGSHRDAWCFGAVDPGSGSAVLMEVVQIFGQLRKLGWRPLRTIEFVSWDAKEYNMIGSTEYVEDSIDTLRDHGIAYLNVDAGLYGPDPVFRAAGSPVWKRAVLHVLDRVSTPGDDAATLKQIWDERQTQFGGLGTDGDYAPFQMMAGMSSLDFGFEGANLKHGYPAHSCYETLDWVKQFSDPDFSWHRTLAQIWALLILELADRPIIPFDVRTYADAIKGPYISTLMTYASAQAERVPGKPSLESNNFSLQPLRDAADELTRVAEEFHRFEDIWTANVLGAGGLETADFAKRRMAFNQKLSDFDRNLLDLPESPIDTDVHGLPGREQFKHVIFGPQDFESGRMSYFPAVMDALEKRNFTLAQQQVDKVTGILRGATDELKR